jgi:hypothetical protein
LKKEHKEQWTTESPSNGGYYIVYRDDVGMDVVLVGYPENNTNPLALPSRVRFNGEPNWQPLDTVDAWWMPRIAMPYPPDLRRMTP